MSDIQKKQDVLALAKKRAREKGFEGEVAEAFIKVFIENFEKGEKIGAEKERAKAEAEKKELKIETAKNLLKMGLSVEQISQATGLSIEELQKLG